MLRKNSMWQTDVAHNQNDHQNKKYSEEDKIYIYIYQLKEEFRSIAKW